MSKKGYQSLETDSEHGPIESHEGGNVVLSTPLSSVTGAFVRGHGSLLTLLSVPSLVLIGFGICLLLIIVSFASYKYSGSSGCLGPPYLYVTHNKEHNIMQLTRDGCLNMNKVLFGVPHGKVEYRSMAVGQYQGESALYVADATPASSEVMIFGDCSYWTNMRSFRAAAFTKTGPYKEGAEHAYGIAFDSSENLYTSFQHTNVVLRAAKDTFKELPTVGIRNKKEKNDIVNVGGSNKGPFLGTFYQFGNATEQNPQDQGVRSIVWTKSSTGEHLWINNEFDNAVYIVDNTGNPVKILNVKRPIGNYHNPYAEDEDERRIVYVGSRGGKVGNVYAFDMDTFEVVRKYSLIGMTHPTGIVVYDEVLYVADQSLGAILTFELHNTRFIKNIWDRHNGGDIEQIVLTNC